MTSLKILFQYLRYPFGLFPSPGSIISDRQLAEAGAHVVMAVRNTKAAHELILKWQYDWSGKGLPLNIEVYTEHPCNFWASIFLDHN